MQIRSVGIDLGKTTFHLVALGAAGKVLVKKKFTQKQLLIFTANMQTSLIGLEACSGAHFLGRALRQQGHDVRLIAAQFVKPLVTSNKNDFVDAEAIAEAVECKNMRFVPIKTDDQDLHHDPAARLRLSRVGSAGSLISCIVFYRGVLRCYIECRTPEQVPRSHMSKFLAGRLFGGGRSNLDAFLQLLFGPELSSIHGDPDSTSSHVYLLGDRLSGSSVG
uniref:IS110 family transposase n=1 Tax=Acidicapsa ligni TaxID=542300 RepID=UPI0021DFF724|nr:transposase [Acidicapsa ligni]